MADHNILDSRYAWIRLALTLLVAVIANVAIWAVVVVLPDIEAEFGASRAEASVPYLLTMFGFAFGNFVIGGLIDRYAISRSLQGSALVIAAGFAATAMAPSITTVSLLHFVLGAGAAVGFGPLMADISHWFLRRRGIAVAVVACGNYLSGTIWPLLLSDLLVSDGWRAVYWMLAAITLVLMLPLSLTLRRRLPPEAQEPAAAAARARVHSAGLSPRALHYLLGLAGLCCCVAMSMPQVHIVAYCVGLGYGPAIGTQMLSLMLMGGVVSRLISGALADKLGGVRTLLLGSVLQAVALFLYLPYDGLVSLYIVSLVFGLSQGGIVPSYTVIVREYMPPREAGARVGMVIMLTILGMALGGWMSGWIYDLTGSYRAAFLNGIAWNGVNIVIMLWLLLRTRPRAPV